ncbi:hypothetical protein SAMN05428961_11470 [Paenibacillus sp. OK060]|uniref:hypothetical protein n=1 Tax=Paenibacillus sp. OK060 TaxID=1881034 RepID=UPI0008895D19|nr:hypothetical protein [Paenibacillus sp. OK060]SDM34177.1 hypothetical protein SAMN05428961_11470 [Paenibacillus sp. OK060]
MKIKRRSLWILVLSILIVVGLVLVIKATVQSNVFEFLKQFRSFNVTIDNQSDYDLTSVETGVLITGPNGGVVESGSRDGFDKEIKSGDVVKITPNLSISGEGGVYLKYSDSSGKTSNKMICSYTETLSGYSNVIITNENVQVDEKCN